MCENARREALSKFSSPAARRGDKLAALANTNFFPRLAALDGPYFIEFDTKLIHLFGFWVGVLINSLNMGSGSALQNIRAESLG